MKSLQLFKTALFLSSAFLWLSCSSSEDVVTVNEFGPLKIISVDPDSANVGDKIIITGENFIEKKEYNQVWFGGNVRGVVDSATATQLFLKVPEGAQSGLLSVSNGMYADTINNFKISPKPLLSIAFRLAGFKIIKQNNTVSHTNGEVTSTSSMDTLNFEFVDSVNQTELSSNIFDGIGGCFQYPAGGSKAPLPDSIFQSVRTPEASRKSYIYTAIPLKIDMENNIIRSLHIIQSEYEAHNSQIGSGWLEKICTQKRIVFENVPYLIINNKITLKLNADQLKNCLTNFIYSREDNNWNQNGGNYHNYSSKFIAIYEILPDAYFEMTLE